MVKHIAFTMYPVKDMKRARRFYEEGLGFGLGKDFGGGGWVEYYLDNGCFALTTMTKQDPSATSGGAIAFEVENVDDAVARLKAKGGGVKVAPFESPVCRMAVLTDPEGNAFMVHAKKA